MSAALTEFALQGSSTHLLSQFTKFHSIWTKLIEQYISAALYDELWWPSNHHICIPLRSLREQVSFNKGAIWTWRERANMDENISQKCFFSRAISNPLDLFIGRSRTGLAFPTGPLGIRDARIGAEGQRGHAFKADLKQDKNVSSRIWRFQSLDWEENVWWRGQCPYMHSKRVR